jgi:hypothetical protein
MQRAVAVDHDLLDLAEQAAFDQELEVLATHPREEALQARPGDYAWFSGVGTTGRS